MPPRVSGLIDSPKDGSPLTEEDFWTACRCGRLFRLSDAFSENFGQDRLVYLCPDLCPDPALLVAPWNGDHEAGWQFGDWMICNQFDLIAFGRQYGSLKRLTAKPFILE